MAANWCEIVCVFKIFNFSNLIDHVCDVSPAECAVFITPQPLKKCCPQISGRISGIYFMRPFILLVFVWYSQITGSFSSYSTNNIFRIFIARTWTLVTCKFHSHGKTNLTVNVMHADAAPSNVLLYYSFEFDIFCLYRWNMFDLWEKKSKSP